MSIGSIAVVGGGGFAREVRLLIDDIARVSGSWAFSGYVSTSEPNSSAYDLERLLWIGDDDAFLANPTTSHYVIAIADSRVRKRLARRYESAGLKSATLIHPTAIIGPDTIIGSGSIVCAFVSITTNVQVGSHVHIDRLTTVGHDVIIDDFATLHPAGVVSGAVHIGEAACIGASSCILPGRQIGIQAVVGAGAVVTHDVPSATTVIGVPARSIPSQGTITQ